MKALWTSIQGDPVFMRRFNGWATLFFLTLWPVSNLTRWVESTSFISNLSILALALASLSAWQASRVEVQQRKDQNK